MNDILVRPTTVDDAAELKRTLLHIWHQTYDQVWGAERVKALASQWHTLEKLKQEALSSSICSLVATDDGALIGHALAYQPKPDCVHLARLYLDHEYHGRGVGKRLLAAALDPFPTAKAVHLEVVETNDRAVGFYRSQGFQVTERIRDEYVDDELYELKMQKVFSSNEQSS